MEFFTSSFVLHESWALIQARLGWDAVEDWLSFLVPRCEVVWVPPAAYERGPLAAAKLAHDG